MPETAGRSKPLVRYRVVGGMAGVDQRLTVFEDGAVELDERHRSRERISLRIEPAEVERLRAALDAVPKRSWSILPKLAAIRSLPTGPAAIQHFEIRRGHRAIAGRAPRDPEIASLVGLLDDIRSRAVRELPR